MRAAVSAILVLLGIAFPQVAPAAGFAHSDNFVVVAPDQAVAEAVLAKAEEYRKRLAVEWLGEELPSGVGQTVIHVEHSKQEDKGLAWPIDTPERTLHKLWVVAAPERVAGGVLYHELTHTVLATQFPGRLPAWADEGAASLKDDSERRAIRRRVLQWCVKTGNWPRLEGLFQRRTINTGDQAGYSAAASLTEYLLTRGSKAAFLRFAVDGKEKGWDSALQRHYDIADLTTLQAQWQAWVEADEAPPLATTRGAAATISPARRRGP